MNGTKVNIVALKSKTDDDHIPVLGVYQAVNRVIDDICFDQSRSNDVKEVLKSIPLSNYSLIEGMSIIGVAYHVDFNRAPNYKHTLKQIMVPLGFKLKGERQYRFFWKN